MSERLPVRELCAAGARRIGEPLFATASRVDLWLVLEVRGAWPDEVGESLDPETPIGRALQPVLQAVPRSRALFIKGQANVPRVTLAFYVAVTDEAESRLYHFELSSYAALEELDLFGVLAGDARWEAHRETLPLYLVCTHGTHDRCCAKFGFPTYCELSRRAPERVWQCSHVGGDRFAANLVVLPQGLYCGQVEPGDADTLLRTTDHGHLHLPRLRGRSCYASQVQAAEHFLRVAEQETAIDAYRLVSHRREREVTDVGFLEAESGRLQVVRVAPAPPGELRFTTCGSTEPRPTTGHRLVERQVLAFTPEVRTAGALEYRLRPAAMRDYGFIYALRRDTLQAYLHELEMPLAEQAPFFARFDVMRHQLITVDGAPAGAVSLLPREAELHLANLHLHPDYQGRSLGTAIVREAQHRAARLGRNMTAQVLKNNPARAFYERLGFRVEGEQGLRYGMRWQAAGFVPDSAE